MSADDFEALLRATLAERAEQAPDADQLSRRVLADIDLRSAQAPSGTGLRSAQAPSGGPRSSDPLVARAAARSRQRRLGRLLVPLASAAAVAAVVALGLVITHEDNSGQSASSAAVGTEKDSSAGTAAAGSPFAANGSRTVAGNGGAPPASTGGVTAPVHPSAAASSATTLPVPAGLRIADLSFDSSATGFALGTSTCSSGTCPTLARLQADGSWTLISTALPFSVGSAGTTGRPVVTDIRFASASVGYAFGPSALFITDNGGVDWTQQSASADALEVADETAVRVSSDSCSSTCTFTVSVAVVGTGTFSAVTVPGAPLVGTGVELARAGANAYLVVRSASGQDEPLLASADDGATWASRQPDLCGTGGRSAARVSSLAAAADGSVTALCTDGADQYTETSADGGLHFSAGQTITTGPVSVVASASATNLITGGTRIYRSVDGGRHWSAVPGVTAATSTRFLGFQDTSTGRWVGAPGGSVWSTSDAGATWTRHAFA